MKATIIFEDLPGGKGMKVNATFDPALGAGGKTNSGAQITALKIMQVLNENGGVVTNVEEES